DFHGKNRWLSVPEIIVYSSNIGAAKMAADVGTKVQREYLARFGLLRRAALELPEVGKPLTPTRWREINTLTIAYGHGIAVSPLQLASGIGALVNGGLYVPPTLLKQTDENRTRGKRILAAETSDQMRDLMRLVVRHGTGRKAAAEGYNVGGKTGTADKLAGRGYAKGATISSFVGAFPINAPRYVVLVLVDEPKGNKRTFNYATGGWVAAPAVGRIVQRMATLIGMPPNRQPPGESQGRAILEKRPLAPVPAQNRVERVSANAEVQMLERVRAVLAAPPKTSGAVASGPPEQALAAN
ncbi:MAG: penicillin-binding transpeptidase domain-containing protein, partial [Rhodospirillales bacterium]